MQDACHNWKCIPIDERTWNWWKHHLNGAFNELKELNAITADRLGYEKKTSATPTLDNLVWAAVSKNETMETLMASNKYHTKVVSKHMQENEKLLQIIEWLTQLPKMHGQKNQEHEIQRDPARPMDAGLQQH